QNGPEIRRPTRARVLQPCSQGEDYRHGRLQDEPEPHRTADPRCEVADITRDQFIHGQCPSISTISDQLRNVRTSTSTASISTFCIVRSSVTVSMMSAATSNSSPSSSALPS